MTNAHNPQRLADLKDRLGRLPRASLAVLPTPLEHLAGVTKALAGPQIWIKRDDLTGLATGGNKTRMFEFTLGKAKEAGVDTVVAGAAVQSNYCRQLAAACAKLGIECHLMLRKVRGDRDAEIQGGLLLDLLVGAKVELMEDVGSWEQLGVRIREQAARLTKEGRNVHIARVGDESALGLYAASYLYAFVELLEQAEAAGLRIDEFWLCSSDTTQSGLALAIKHLESPIRLVGLPALPEPVTPGRTFPECFTEIGNGCAELLGLDTRLVPEDLVSITDYVGEGYAIMTDEARSAMRLFGSSDGILLDPVYTSKAAAGLIDHIRKGLIPRDRNVVFLHTGGIPALFAFADDIGLSELLE